MTRRVGFSSGHRYWFDSLTEPENRELFGPWASKFSHGHNYFLEATVEGHVDPVTGMVVNIKSIDDVLRAEIVGKFDGRSLNDEVAHFETVAPCVENILNYAWSKLSSPGVLPPGCKLVKLRLEETPLFNGELKLEPKMLTLTRTYEFAASHRLHAPGLSDAENIELFGKCNNPAGHGHNYLLEVTFTGPANPSTGMIADLDAVDAAVEREVVKRYDHKNLSVDLPEFADKPATSEYVAKEIFDRLKGKIPADLVRIRLHETARNIFEVDA